VEKYAVRPIEDRHRHCVMCGESVLVRSVTSPHLEAPEMLSVPPGSWIGFVAGDTAPEMVAVCSEACVQELLVR
jgi:predicted nucleic acid-binding Zn ribbon protein